MKKVSVFHGFWKFFLLLQFTFVSLWITPARAGDGMTFAACGDILPDRGIRRAMEIHGPSYPFSEITPLLRSFEIVFGNLEAPLSNRGTEADRPVLFRGDPLFAGELALAGFTFLSLANNHALDYGSLALADTISVLRLYQMVPLGAGYTREEATLPYIMEKNGVRLAFFASFPAGQDSSPATGTTINTLSPSTLAEQIQEVKKDVDIVVVSLHWGIEYSPRPSSKQKYGARTLIEAGADLILGHHPHCMQGIERYRGGYIVYSLGNCIFDGRRREEKEAFLFTCTIASSGIRNPYVIPLVIHDGQARIARGEDYTRIADTLISLSGELGTLLVNGKDGLFLP